MGIKLQILSDLHLEFGPAELLDTDADVIVLAGDIAPGVAGLRTARSIFPQRPVVYVAGNHEYYGHSWPQLTEDIQREAKGTHVHYLDNSEVILHGVRFLGCTMWTDFDLFGKERRQEISMFAHVAMNDYRVIRESASNRQLRPIVTRGLHVRSRTWLERALAKPFKGRTVVVTHHAPSFKSIDPLNYEDPLNAAYASNLESLMDGRKIALWVHGHTHRSCSYEVNGTLVVSNQHGYPHQQSTGFNPGLVIEL